mmetsp:Transcript_17470/g.19735  ORF Transcript_17470/g.19735 Transcript_17470/m.19735 type:complete len:362 (-) Transcript_17470:201-1286(-)
MVIIEKGAISLFVKLLSSNHYVVQEQAMWALGNIAGDAEECRDLVLDANALEPLCEILMQTQNINLVKNGAWTLSNLCRGKPAPLFSKVKKAIPCLAHIIKTSTDEEILIDACWALSYISDGSEVRINAVVKSGLTPRLVELLSNQLIAIQIPCLRTLGNIVTGSEEQTQLVINNGALAPLLELLHSPKRPMRRETCWTISNIAAGTPTQIQSLIDTNIMSKVIEMLGKDRLDVQKEAVWVLSNAASGGNLASIDTLVEIGALDPLLGLLEEQDPRVLVVSLEAIEMVLKAGQEAAKVQGENPYALKLDQIDGISKIEQLQTHENNEIYKKAFHIIETYFGIDDGSGETGDDSVIPSFFQI